ncbi:MBL fold metallo-hydrolase [Chachezhania sediminis]|uniref:MBL fold metallo-hydrolase n=1 Tax=Chachezhania sediminis TaxID=2599291 RepID=UPI00131B57BC|nr:MBL fold metallo-hydrolase [Chachezhania sediminis]
MKMEQVSNNCYAVLNEKNRVCDANSGLINIGGGMVIDTQSDLPHAQAMINMFSRVWTGMPEKVVNTHEDSDHVYGNQLFGSAQIIGHRSLPERMKLVADPDEFQHMIDAAQSVTIGSQLKAAHPGVFAAAKQIAEDYEFRGVHLVPPSVLFDDRLKVVLDDVEVHIIHVGPCHQAGDSIVWLPRERVLFAGDVLFRLCTPMGWVGSFNKWYQALDMIINELKPDVIVPGHGPVCGLDGVHEMKSYLQYVEKESRIHFDDGRSASEAARRIDLGPYADWLCPERIYMNVERAYREFRSEPQDKPWDKPETFDEIYGVAITRGLTPTF